MFRSLFFVMLTTWSSLAFAFQEPTPLYKNSQAPIAARVDNLIQQMTLEEKVAQLESRITTTGLGGVAVPSPFVAGHVDPAYAKQFLQNGIGTFAFLDDFFGTAGPAINGVEKRNMLQRWVTEQTRLGIPILFHGEALHGAVTRGATVFPQAIALGSTWDPDLLQEMFGFVAKEARASGNTLILAPVLDLSRDPRFGRVEEMYSEDPFLTSRLGVAAIRGLQGDAEVIDQSHVIATAKHFVHGQPENGTNVGPNDVSERTMREVFLPPFRDAVQLAHVGAVMPSYNENSGGIPSSENTWLLQTVLRKEWGFAGITTSDYFAVDQLFSLHHVASDRASAGLLAFKAGVDMELPTPFTFPALVDAVKTGKLPESQIDDAVRRVLTVKFRAGLFENPYVAPELTQGVLGAKDHSLLARKVADEAMILLKNDKALLPLDSRTPRTIAVIGPNADKMRLGTYSGTPPYFVTVLDGIRKRLGPASKVLYAEGCRISAPDISPSRNSFMPYQAPDPKQDEDLIKQAIAAAKSSDIIVLVLGGNESVSRESFGNGGGVVPVSYGDSDTIELPGQQLQLIQAIAKIGKPIIAVLLNGKPYAIEKLVGTAQAVLEGWYLGQETGNAVAGALFGDVNPSGHLPVSIARNVGQLPVFYYKTPAARRGYVFDENTPLFPFGFGLSYTTFQFAPPVLDRQNIAADGTATLSVLVTNSGPRAGATVVQMYVHHEYSSVVQPVKLLKGFSRVLLMPGESKTVRFQVGPKELSFLDAQMRSTVEAGPVTLTVGEDSTATAQVLLTVLP